jgi:hypothetical protein
MKTVGQLYDASKVLHVGDLPPSPPNPNNSSSPTNWLSTGYVPVLMTLNGVNRVVGFGFCTLPPNTSFSIPPSATTSINLTKLTNQVATVNATCHFLTFDPSLGSDTTTVLNNHDNYDSSVTPMADPLLAPALVRSIR